MKKIFLLILLFVPCLVFGADKIDINNANLSQLDQLTGIGPTYAQRIIDGRPYSSIDDLDRVKGIGPATIQKIKDQGLAYVGTQISPSIKEISSASTSPIVNISETPKEAIIYPSGIYISEILPNPKGPDETDEWVKIYNSNNNDVSISKWILKDTNGSPSIYTFPENTNIGSNNFLVVKRPESKIMLNNEGDGLILLNPNNETVDSLTFTKAPLGQTYIRTSSGWRWSGSNTLPKTEISVNNNGIEAGLADLTQNINQESNNNNPWFLFYTVLIITIILASILIFIKLKLYKNHVRT